MDVELSELLVLCAFAFLAGGLDAIVGGGGLVQLPALLVVLPQAVRTVTPPLLNDFVALQKDVGLISVLTVTDAVRASQIIVGQTFNFTPYVLAGLLFVLLAVPSARLADHFTVRALRRQQGGSR